MYDVIVTRPEPKNSQLCQLLVQYGHNPLSLPLIDSVPYDFEQNDDLGFKLRDMIFNIDRYDGIICISQPAAECLSRCLDYCWPAMPVGIEWWALGSASCKPLRELGLKVDCPASGFDSESLLSMPRFSGSRIAEEKWLIVKGQDGRQLLLETLEQRGANVCALDVYSRKLIEFDDAQLTRIYDTLSNLEKSARCVQMATSVELLQAWWKLLNSFSLGCQIREKFLKTPILVISERIKSEAVQLGFNRVIVAEKPDNQTLVKTLEEVKYVN